MQQIADSYRKIRNTFKFILGNLGDFDEAKHAVPYEELSDLDKWLLHELSVLWNRVFDHYENFEFHMVYRRILNFCAVELSSVYFDISKDILYIELKDSRKRRANQTVLNEINKILAPLIAPILAFTADEIWQFNGAHTETIHLTTYYKPPKQFYNEAIAAKMESLVMLKNDSLKALENKRRDKVIKGSLEADLSIFTESQSLRSLVAELGDELRRFLQVSSVTMESAVKPGMEKFDNAHIGVEKTKGKKCVRCWNFYESVGSDPSHPELCGRCTDIVKAWK
jgi:isoleucyl-tRNA synthetase